MLHQTLALAGCLLGATAVAEPVRWDFPREQPQEGIPFADSKTGVLVWNGDGFLDVTVGRGDWWEHRGGSVWQESQSYSNIVALVKRGERDTLKALFKKTPVEGQPGNPFMLPLGRIRFDLVGAKAVRGELDPMTGLGSITFLKDGRELTAELAMSFKTGAFAIRWPDGFVPKGRAIAAWDSAIGNETEPRCRKPLQRLGYAPPTYRGNAEDGLAGGFTQTTPYGDPSAEMDFVTKDGATLITSGRGGSRAGVLAQTDWAETRADSLAFWTTWWKDAPRIDVPDPEIAEMFYFGMYKFGAMTDADGIPAGLQGQWLEDFKFPPWNGDYHFNINVEECYWPAYHGNKVRNLLPLFRMIKSWWPVLRANAKAFVGIDDGFVLPHAVDDRGTCIGGFWTGTIDHGSTAWMAAYMFRYVRYSNDLAFLKSDAYPFMKGAFNVYWKMMAEDNGKLCIPVGPSPEYGWTLDEEVNKNSSFQLAAAHRLTRDLIKAAELLGETPDPRWLDVEKRLPPFGVAMDGECKKGEQIGLYDGLTIRMSHRHHSHLAGLVPFDTIDFTKENVKAIRTAMWWFGWQGPGLWAGWSYPWAAMLYMHVGEPAAAYWALKSWNFNFVNPGHGSRHNHYYHGLSIMGRDPMTRNGDYIGNEVMQMDGQMAATAAVQDMMVHERGGVVRLFSGCPDRWKRVSFDNMLVEGGFLVSATRENGKLTRLVVKRPAGSAEKLRLAEPGTGRIIEREGSAQTEATAVSALLDRAVDEGRVAGVVSVLSDADCNETYDCAGWADLENRRPMTPDTLFAVFSMTKTLTGTAIMCAIDEGRMSLDDEVAKFLPEFADVRMKDGSVPRRPLTVRDLTSHMSGFRGGPSSVNRDIPLREVARRLASQPLETQPGEVFSYGSAWFCAAAACLEVAVGEPYERYLRRKVLDPLGMKDTTYWPTQEQLGRLVRAYTTDGGPLRPAKDGCTPQLEFPKSRRICAAAGSGLFSTPRDMVRFSQMLAHHGERRGVRIVSRKTFDTVFAVRQTPPSVRESYTCGSWLEGDWFGHEGAMRTDQRANLRTGQSRVFFIQTENKAGPAFFDLKRDWLSACDKVQAREGL